jgi:hypothetical protein
MAAPKNGPRKQRTALPISVIKDAVKRLANRLTADDQEADPAKKLDHKTVTAMSNSIEKLCRIVLVNDRQGRPENQSRGIKGDTVFDR